MSYLRFITRVSPLTYQCRTTIVNGFISTFEKRKFHLLSNVKEVIGRSAPCAHNGAFVQDRFYSSEERNVDLTYEDLEALMRSRDIQLIDVREPKELIEYGKIPGAVNIPLGQLHTVLEQMSPADFHKSYGVKKPELGDENIVFSCMVGGRSLTAVQIAEKIGYSKARHYKGGWQEYAQRTGQPLKKNEPTTQ